MKPAETSQHKEDSQDQPDPPVFRSYFELLEAKYQDGEAPSPEDDASAPDASQAKSQATSQAKSQATSPTVNEAAARPLRMERSGNRRREGRQWLVTGLTLVLLAGAVVAGVWLLPEGQPLTEEAANADSQSGEPGESGESGESGDLGASGDQTSTEESAADAATSSREATSRSERPRPDRRRPATQGEASRDRRAESAPGEPDRRRIDSPQSTEIAEDGKPPQVESADRKTAAAADGNAVNELVQPSEDSTPEDSTPEDSPVLAQEADAIEVAGPEAGAPKAPSTPTRSPAPVPEQDSIATSDETVAAGEVTLPRKVFAPQPSYPLTARQRGEEGTVVISGFVTPRGDVRGAKVTESVTPALDRAALEAFRTWQFLPARRAGTAIESAYRVAFHFTIDQDRPPAKEPRQASSPPPAAPVASPAATSPAATSPPAASPLPYGGDFTPPARLVTPLPAYPRNAWSSGATGDVVLQIVVELDGSVSRVDIVQGLAPGIDEAASAAVKRWRFRPATRDGKPVRVEHRVTLRFAP